MKKHTNDNGNSRNENSWKYDFEILGYDPTKTIYPVTTAEMKIGAFRQDACNVIANIIKDIPHRDAWDHFMTTWANFKGGFIGGDGKELIFSEYVTDAVPEEWMRDNFKHRKPSDPPIRLRKENSERLLILFSLAKIIRPVEMALAGKIIANDNKN